MSSTYRRDMSVQSVLKRHPKAVRIFERLGIDDGGQGTIGDAAQSEALPPDLLLAALEATDPAAGLQEHEGEDNFEAMFQEAITEYIEMSHHAFMKAELPRLEQLMNRALNADSPTHHGMLESLREIFLTFRADVEKHLEVEEEILFPRLRNIYGHAITDMPRSGAPSVSSPSVAVAEMAHEHDVMEDALQEMRALTSDYTLGDDAPDVLVMLYDGLREMEDDLEQHFRLENDYLWPMRVTQSPPPDISHTPKTDATVADEASLICPRTNQRCENGSPAECDTFWDCVRQAMHQRWEATDDE